MLPRQAFLWFHRRRFTSFLKFSPKKISIADAPHSRTYLSAPYLWLKVETAFTGGPRLVRILGPGKNRTSEIRTSGYYIANFH